MANWAEARQFPYVQRVQGPDGENVIVDSAIMDYFSSTAPEPTQMALDSLMDQTCAVRVFKDGCRATNFSATRFSFMFLDRPM